MEFMYSEDETTSSMIRSAIFQALGAASTCWEYPDRAGVFDSVRAKEIGDSLIDELVRLKF